MDMRTIVYIDGFNLYYRALKGTAYKWLDIEQLCVAALPPGLVLDQVKYFTAPVNGLPNDPAPNRQRIYFAALRAHCPRVTTILGRFSVHAVKAQLVTPGGQLDLREVSGRNQRICQLNVDVKQRNQAWTADPGPYVHIIKTEEKASDVNLAVHLVHDACAKRAECFVVISNDSDLSEAMRIVRHDCGMQVGHLTAEGTKPSSYLKRYATWSRTIRTSDLKASQLPDNLPGNRIVKPAGW